MLKLILGLIGLSLSCAIGSASLANSHVIVANRSGGGWIRCSCIAAASACKSRILNQLSAQSGFITWRQQVGLQEGKSVDLSLACWRKRDTPQMGEGTCCQNSGTEKDVQFFWGELD